jgi:hypothetical protein
MWRCFTHSLPKNPVTTLKHFVKTHSPEGPVNLHVHESLDERGQIDVVS